jgi:uncharacterized repeat protein (TIGR03803 family)
MQRTFLPAFAIAVAGFIFACGAEAATYTVVHDFCGKRHCTDGAQPWSPPVTDGANNWFGTTPVGGDNNDGTIYRMSFAGGHGSFTRLYSFCSKKNCADGRDPQAGLIIDSSGNLYGTTKAGGSGDDGVVFELVKGAGTWTYKVLYKFCSQANCADGATPYDVTLGYPGMSGGSAYNGIVPLYGTTSLGGAANLGVVFSLTPGGGSWTEQVIHDFCQDASCSDGNGPQYGVVVDGAGNVFGVTGRGGKHAAGVLFEMVEGGGSWTYDVLHNFCAETSCADGNNPVGPLLTDIDLNVYGATDAGGTSGGGTIFKLVPNGARSKLFTLYTFCAADESCPDGEHPRGGLVQDSVGLIYGVAGAGGDMNVGTIWRLSGAKHTVFTRLVSFGDGSTPGLSPLGGLFIVNPNGPFYGTASFGGANNNGVLFKLKK